MFIPILPGKHNLGPDADGDSLDKRIALLWTSLASQAIKCDGGSDRSKCYESIGIIPELLLVVLPRGRQCSNSLLRTDEVITVMVRIDQIAHDSPACVLVPTGTKHRWVFLIP